MSWSYDALSPTSDRDMIRLLIADTDDEPDNHFFEDEELDAFLSMETDMKLAAAQALDTIASQEALILKKIRILDLTTDGPAVAAELRARANELREQFYGGSADLPQTAEMVVDDFTYRERVRNEALREGG